MLTFLLVWLIFGFGTYVAAWVYYKASIREFFDPNGIALFTSFGIISFIFFILILSRNQK